MLCWRAGDAEAVLFARIFGVKTGGANKKSTTVFFMVLLQVSRETFGWVILPQSIATKSFVFFDASPFVIADPS